MKATSKILTFLIVALCWMLVAQSYDYLTVSLHDGTKVGPFYAVAIDSITYSKSDLDGVTYDNWKVQKIWTADSVYSYRIDDVDSISFTEGINNELPVGQDSLKVLIIGNSFVDDPMAYFDLLVRESGIDRNTLCVYSAVKSGASLEYWAKTCQDGDTVRITRRSGLMSMPVTEAPLEELLLQDWDVVTVQQVSTLARNPKKLYPSLPYLMTQIRNLCPNKNVVIGWHQIWSYWNNEGQLEESVNDWEAISDVVELTYGYGIDMIVPTGTAIQNARMSELNTEHGLTRDGKHLGYGVGRYVAACTWFESLISPVYGVSVVGNPAIHEITEAEEEYSTYETSAVTDLNRVQCQQCAASAVSNPYGLVSY